MRSDCRRIEVPSCPIGEITKHVSIMYLHNKCMYHRSERFEKGLSIKLVMCSEFNENDPLVFYAIQRTPIAGDIDASEACILVF